LATFLSIIGFIIAFAVKREDKYVMYYAKQSLVIFIIIVILGIVQAALLFLPVIGWIINLAVSLLSFILWLVSWIYALSGEEKEIPIVSELAEKFEF